MKRRVRAAGLVGAIGAAMFVLLPFASLARADGPTLAGLSMDGTARGLQVTFGFKDFILGNVVDIASPHAHTELSSTGAGTSRAVAAQLFPGDIVAGNGQARENIPGFREANYPPSAVQKGEKDFDKDDDTYTLGPPQTADPLTIATSHLKTHASADSANSLVTTQRFELAGSGGPLLAMTSMETTSDANGAGNTIVEQARTTVKNLTLTVSDQLTIRIGQIEAIAQSSTDGVAGDAVATFTISNAEVILNGQHFQAAIDQDGIKLAGISGAPPTIPQSLAQETALKILDKYGISITTSKPVRILNGAAADATVGGLLISVRGEIPSVFTPQQAADLIDTVFKATEGLRSRELCPEALRDPTFPLGASTCTLNGVCPNAAAPLCVTPAVVPGPGQGFVTSFAIGLAHAAASAAPAFEFGPPLPPGEFGGGTFGGGTGEIISPPGGFTENPAPNGTGPARTPQLFGLVAKMPPGALLGAGTALVVLAVAIGFGPSLRPEGRAGR